MQGSWRHRGRLWICRWVEVVIELLAATVAVVGLVG
jgi:hypothetical protein